MQDQIEGIVENIIYENDENGYCVFNILTEEGQIVTAVGNICNLFEGEILNAVGKWTNHAQYGRQFICEEVERSFPYESAQIIKFLSSGAIYGVGPATAKSIVEHFGTETFDIIESEPQRLSQIRGITKERAIAISNSFRKSIVLREVLDYLSSFHIQPNVAVEIYKKFGVLTKDKLEDNPYDVWEAVPDFDFQTADRIALELGFDEQCKERIFASIKFVLIHNLQNGHTFLPFDKLKMVSSKVVYAEEEIIESSILKMIGENIIIMQKINDVDAVYLKDYYICEKEIADKIMSFSIYEEKSIKNIDNEIKKIEEQLGIEYAESQKEAIKSAIENNIMVLTGGPGTGKTTTLKGIITLFENLKMDVTLCAPTGRAAKRMSDVCLREAKTIHRLLEVNVAQPNTFVNNEKNPLKTDVVIVDETSMVDAMLFNSLLKAIRAGTRLILVGDADQLPSVGAGNCFKDIIGSKRVKTVCLTEIFRQARQSKIVTNAHLINKGIMPDLENDDKFFFISRKDGQSTLEAIKALVCKRIPTVYKKDVYNGLQVICATKKGIAGTKNINDTIKEILNPGKKEIDYIRFKDTIFRIGDKVMQVKNNYDIVCTRKDTIETGVYNGDIGIIEKIIFNEKKVVIRFDDRVAEYDYNDLDQLESAYAITVHKSQGSEFDIVVLVVSDMAKALMYRNLLYTAITRAKDMLIIVGNAETIEKMVENNKHTNRYSGLKYMLKDYKKI